MIIFSFSRYDNDFLSLIWRICFPLMWSEYNDIEMSLRQKRKSGETLMNIHVFMSSLRFSCFPTWHCTKYECSVNVNVLLQNKSRCECVTLSVMSLCNNFPSILLRYYCIFLLSKFSHMWVLIKTCEIYYFKK